MSESAERIYALLVDANPVPDVDTMPKDSAHKPHLYVINARSDEMQTQTPSREKQPSPPEHRSRRTWIPAVAAAAVAVVAIGIAALAFNADETATEVSPEDVVAQVIEASNARDADALAALYDPEIVHTYDASPVTGHTFDNTIRTGRENVLELLEGYVWPNWGPKVTSYEVLEVDDGTVTTSENVTMFGWSGRHVVSYEVSDDGLILAERHVAQEG